MAGSDRDSMPSVVRIVAAARLYTSGIFPLGTHQSLPVPMMTGKGPYLAFMYCRAETVEPGEGPKLWPPHHLTYVSAATGKLERIVSCAPTSFGLSDPPDSHLGSALTSAERQADTFITLRVQLAQAYDGILPAFWGDRPMGHDEPGAGDRDQFHTLFFQVAEMTLAPYYRALGNAFFAWLKGHS